jgi:hypothetical protein
MKKLIAKSTTILLLLQLTTVAYGADIIGGKSNNFIKIETSNDLRKFSLCSKKENACSELGNGRWFDVNDLSDQRNIEMVQAGLSTIASAGAVIFAFYGATVLTVVTVTSTTASLSVGAVASVGTGIGSNLLELGPSEQLKQQYLLRSEVIYDEEIILSAATDKDIKKIAKRLDVVLQKI